MPFVGVLTSPIMNVRTSLVAAVLTATAIGSASACAADDQSIAMATSTAAARTASLPSPTPGTPAFLAQQLVGKPSSREASVPVGRADRDFLTR